MRLILVLFLIFSVSASFGQNREITKFKKKKEFQTSSGLKMTFYSINKNGMFPDSGDVVRVHYLGVFEDGKKFDSSFDRNRPLELPLGQGRVIKGWEEALRYMREGDSAKVVIPPALGYGEREYGSIPANSTLTFYMKMVSIQPKPKPYDVAGLDTVKTESGLMYIVVKKGKGKTAQINDKAKVRYSGYFVNGDKFDSSFDHPGAETFDFIIGRKQVIEGWEKGVAGMAPGEKRRLIIPYLMAYGEQGRPPVIPAMSDLIFDVELVDFETIIPPMSYDVKGKDTITTSTGLMYIKVKTTNGRQVMSGDTVTATYTGYFTDGSIFDSSVERNDSITLPVGRGMVIRGWDEGLQKMKEGEKFRFIIPYYLAYGEQGRPPVIPAKSDLIFDVYLKRIENKN
ncbi:MAG: FKBP-type peptidyl-prolyl cis-trans isomerase [Bacteroidales bacterium]|nr:FKBP-type peptidyl-prolyl cis-trans isomerase [Bacteroidales bacterium]